MDNVTITLKEAKKAVNKVLDLPLNDLHNLDIKELASLDQNLNIVLASKLKKADREDFEAFRETLAEITAEKILQPVASVKAPKLHTQDKKEDKAPKAPKKETKAPEAPKKTPEEMVKELEAKKKEAQQKAQAKKEADKKVKEDKLQTSLKEFRAIKEGEKFIISVKDSEDFEDSQCIVKLVDEHSIILVDQYNFKYEITFDRWNNKQWNKYIDNKKETLVIAKA